MNIAKTRILGSNYAGLFGVCSDELCILPAQVDKKTEELVEKVLEVKTIKTSIYASPLLAVFAKMNNKYVYLPKFVEGKEIETIEKEAKVKIINTENALGNLVELNDTGAIISKLLSKKAAEEIKNTGLNIEQMNPAQTEVTGAALVATNKGFLINPNATKEEVKRIEEILGVKGGSSTANTGDMLVRNSILANKKGILLGEGTSPHEINRIEEALSGE
ncbi:MAG: translation initiation factor IF-6 [Candidatus Diapherotrites archaeon]|nr:translation initiation factor IF-6 [Candidatus Diapherotrites archaeon]